MSEFDYVSSSDLSKRIQYIYSSLHAKDVRALRARITFYVLTSSFSFANKKSLKMTPAFLCPESASAPDVHSPEAKEEEKEAARKAAEEEKAAREAEKEVCVSPRNCSTRRLVCESQDYFFLPAENSDSLEKSLSISKNLSK